jgi:hypothetical protein
MPPETVLTDGRRPIGAEIRRKTLLQPDARPAS